MTAQIAGRGGLDSAGRGRALLRRFLDDDTGLVTLDWVMLTAGVGLTAMATVAVLGERGASPLVDRIGDELAGLGQAGAPTAPSAGGGSPGTGTPESGGGGGADGLGRGGPAGSADAPGGDASGGDDHGRENDDAREDDREDADDREDDRDRDDGREDDGDRDDDGEDEDDRDDGDRNDDREDDDDRDSRGRVGAAPSGGDDRDCPWNRGRGACPTRGWER
jgi:hypothetical protein